MSGELIVSGLDSATSLIQVIIPAVSDQNFSLYFSGGEKLDERGGVDGEGILCGQHQVQEVGDEGASSKTVLEQFLI